MKKKNWQGPRSYNTLVKYTSNNLDKIKCINKKGLEVWLTIDRNTRIILIKKSGLKAQGYFDTVILREDTLYAIESRISGGRQKILLKDIDRVVIKAEFAETKVAK